MSRELATIHESGHATVAIALGLTVERVELLDEEPPRGFTQIDEASVCDPANAHKLVLIAVAGLVAEQMQAPAEGLTPNPQAWRSDIEIAIGLLRATGLTFDEASDRLADATAQAAALLEDYANLRRSIEGWLHQEGTLTALILDNVTECCPPWSKQIIQN